MSQPTRPMSPPSSRELVYDDGEPMESARHVEQMTMLIRSLRNGLRDREDIYVGGNMFLYFSETQSRRNDFRGPDVFIVLGTTQRERRAWVVWEEDGRAPDVIIELLSESTEKVDRGEKMRIYARTLHVAEYFLFDPFSGGILSDPHAPGPSTEVIGKTSAFKTSTGAEVRFFMPVLNVPFRLIFAANPQRGGVLDNQLQPQKAFQFRFAVGTTF